MRGGAFVLIFFASVHIHGYGQTGEMAVNDINKLILAAQEEFRQKNVEEALIKYQIAAAQCKSAGNIESDMVLLGKYVHCLSQITAIRLFGFQFAEKDRDTQQIMEDLGQAKKEINEIISLTEGYLDYIDDTKYPYLFVANREALFNLALILEAQNDFAAADALLLRLKTELDHFNTLSKEIRAGKGKAIMEKEIPIESEKRKFRVKDVHPATFSSLSGLYLQVEREIVDRVSLDMIFHPEKYRENSTAPASAPTGSKPNVNPSGDSCGCGNVAAEPVAAPATDGCCDVPVTSPVAATAPADSCCATPTPAAP